MKIAKIAMGAVWSHYAALGRVALIAAPAVLSTAVARGQQPVAAPPVDSASALAFRGATVIDVETGRRLPDQTIVVAGNRIRAVGPSATVRPPAGARVIPAYGTYVIPGLWDMHVHVLGFPNTYFPLFLANGVTGVRDMATPFLDSMLLWRREIKEGRRAGPRIITAGPSVSSRANARGQESLPLAGGRRGPVHMVGADTPEEGRRVVDSLKQAGADFIKVYDELTREVYFAILTEARRVGLPVAGHVPQPVTPLEASDSGQRSIEHNFQFAGCTDTVPDVRRCREVAAHLRRNDTWVMPGPFVFACGPCQRPWYREQDRYWPDSLFNPFNQSGLPPYQPRVPAMPLAQWAAIHAGSLQTMYIGRQGFRLAQQSGLRFLAGMDASPYGFFAWPRPGFSLHDLLWDFVDLGLTPLEALQTATLNPARYFHATDTLGTVAANKIADFVFLDADPLQDIYNTRRIRAVVADGRFYDRADLDSLLTGVERLAKQSRRP